MPASPILPETPVRYRHAVAANQVTVTATRSVWPADGTMHSSYCRVAGKTRCKQRAVHAFLPPSGGAFATVLPSMEPLRRTTFAGLSAVLLW